MALVVLLDDAVRVLHPTKLPALGLGCPTINQDVTHTNRSPSQVLHDTRFKVSVPSETLWGPGNPEVSSGSMEILKNLPYLPPKRTEQQYDKFTSYTVK